MSPGRHHRRGSGSWRISWDGNVSITTTDGETRQFRTGDVVRVEDTSPCKGHITVVGDQPGFLMISR